MTKRVPNYLHLTASAWQDYELLDSGFGYTLERFGGHTFVRPEERAVWKRALGKEAWEAAAAIYTPAEKGGGGNWQYNRDLGEGYPIQYKHLTCWINISASRQLGVFPENAVHWDWLEEKISNTRRQINVLNLFAYTGMASLAAAHAGARVTHVDSAKRAISLARHNQSLSGLEDKPIRWIVDDALKFTQREIRRGVKYDAIIMDPPKYGLGPNKERWEFYKLFPELCQACRSVLSEKPLFIIVTTYGIELAPDELAQYVSDMLFGFRGDLEMGELITKEKSAGRILSKAIYVRWCAKDAG